MSALVVISAFIDRRILRGEALRENMTKVRLGGWADSLLGLGQDQSGFRERLRIFALEQVGVQEWKPRQCWIPVGAGVNPAM